MPILSGKCTSKAKLDGKTAVITGCNTGIGKETVKDFVKRGCRVIMACRDICKAEDAADEIRKETTGVEGVGVIVVVRLDLSSFASVRECAAQLLQNESQINLLINNAGVMMCPKGLTEDGFETQIAVNHLSHFLFTLLLLPMIRKSTPARIVIVSSLAHEQSKGMNFEDFNWDKSYSARLAYARSKLANVLFAKELATRLERANVKGITTYSLHPGVINTDLGRHLDTAFFSGAQWINKHVLGKVIKTPTQGAQTTIFCAVDEKAANETGLYYSDCVIKRPSSKARDPALALRLWDESLKMVGIEHDPFSAEECQLTKAAKANDIVKEGAKTSEIVKEGVKTSEIVKEGAKTSEIVKEGAKTSEIVKEGAKTSEIVKEGAKTSEIVKDGAKTTEIVKEGAQTSEIVKEGAKTSEIVKDGAKTTEIVKEGAKTTEIVKEGATTSEIVKEGATTTKIVKEGATTTEIVKEGAITSEIVKEGAKTSEIVKEGAKSSHIAEEAVKTSEIMKEGAKTSEMEGVKSSHIAEEAVKSSYIAEEAVKTSEIVKEGVKSSHIAEEAVISSKIAEESVKSSHIAEEAVISSKIAEESVKSSHIAEEIVKPKQSSSQEAVSVLPK